MSWLTNQDWADFEKAINETFADFHTKVATWKKSTSTLSRYGESNSKQYQDIPLSIMCNYNYMRSWPITHHSEVGALDRQSVQIYILKSYLTSIGALNASGYWDYQPDKDLLVIDGLTYSFEGDTPVSQSKNGDLFITAILKRIETPTGNKR